MANVQITIPAATLFQAPCVEHFWVYPEGDETGFSLANATCDGAAVTITEAGYAHKDMDGFDVYRIIGTSEGAKLVGTFYNEQKFEAALKAIGLPAWRDL